MDNQIEHTTPSSNSQLEFDANQKVPQWFVWVLRIAIALMIVFIGFRVYKWYVTHKPTRERRPRGERVGIVELTPLQRENRRVTIKATGTVVPSRELALSARVSGEVVEVNENLQPGGRLAAGAVAVKLDRSDYALALRRATSTLSQMMQGVKDAQIAQRQANNQVALYEAQVKQAEAQLMQSKSQLKQAAAQVVTAEYNYKLELGQQDVAKYEWNLIEDKDKATELERELTLRAPHLRKAKADVDSAKAGVVSAEGAVSASEGALAAAKANLEIGKENVESAKNAVVIAQVKLQDAEAAQEQAKLDLDRTTVTVPFNAVVLDRSVTIGTQVGSQTGLATLVDADAFWIEISIPLDRVNWIQFPGAAVTVRSSGSLTGRYEWSGQVIRRLPQLESNGRQARFLVEVKDPLRVEDFRKDLPLLLDSFVYVDIAGPELEKVFVIPRTCLHNGDEVWLRNEEKRLEVVSAKSIWGNDAFVIVPDGLPEGREMVVGDVASAVPGMLLRTVAEEEKQAKAKAPGGGKPGKEGVGEGKLASKKGE